jgi:hypothetical protein
MVEVIGGLLLVALVWVVAYGMSATDSKQPAPSIRQNDTTSRIKRAA